MESEKYLKRMKSLMKLSFLKKEEPIKEEPIDSFDEFNRRLFMKHPAITKNEKLLCGFLKLNMCSREIAELTGKSISSIEIARTKLRKKIGLTNSKVNLNSFMDSI